MGLRGAASDPKGFARQEHGAGLTLRSSSNFSAGVGCSE
jgi:hypothetical protein